MFRYECVYRHTTATCRLTDNFYAAVRVDYVELISRFVYTRSNKIVFTLL